ncbi:serine hydrolase [Arenibaculum sp.]|jgi:hypothetical protein|uniref:serine hydrolase n=1 Tax=Arenibaculum sp. TaxID=2865862 RepID=UPI002E0F18B0|nr:serine hydrolase [Arenibaculum sp.]
MEAGRDLAGHLEAVIGEAGERFGPTSGPNAAPGPGPDGPAAGRIAATWRVARGGAGTGTGAVQASHGGDVPFEAACVVKLFLMVALHGWYEAARLAPTPELERACRDMIVDGVDDATHLVLDALTGTTGGIELPEPEMSAWREARNAVNRWFGSWCWPEFDRINVCQKTYAQGPYGRERVSRGARGENANRLTTDATVRLLAAIMEGRAVSPGRSAAMRALLERDPADPRGRLVLDGFLGAGVPRGSRVWAMPGRSGSCRHDAAHILLPDGTCHTLAVFTRRPASDCASDCASEGAAERALLPWIAGRLLGPA